MNHRRQKKTKFRLLGVDPSPSLRAALGQLGEECGMAVDLCTSLAEVRALLAETFFDLVIAAAELPDGAYPDVLASVREQPEMVLTPVLLLVAGRGEGLVQEALGKGITEVFFKRDFQDLVRYLENFGGTAPTTKGKASPPKALVVEDDRALGALYKTLLSQHGFIVDHVPSGEAALWEAERRRYDFILVDLVLSGACSGIQFLRRLRQPGLASSRAVAIAISSYADAARRLEALRAGANAFMAKPLEERELAAHVEGMAQRPPVAPADRQAHAGNTADVTPAASATNTAADAAPTCQRCQPCQLTPREFNICALVTTGYTDKRIAEEMGVSYWTVRTHIAHAFKKCDVGNRVELVRRLRGG